MTYTVTQLQKINRNEQKKLSALTLFICIISLTVSQNDAFECKHDRNEVLAKTDVTNVAKTVVSIHRYTCSFENLHRYACCFEHLQLHVHRFGFKAAGPSGIIAEMLKPLGEAGVAEVRDLIEDIISEGCIPIDWQESFIVNLYKGKGDALNRGNYRGLKLIEQTMKVLERVVEGLIRQRGEIDEMQCGFMSGCGTTDAIFIVRQLQEKHLAANKLLYMAFVDLEKAFDRVPRDVIWWAMRKLGIDEWLVRLVQSMYKDVRSRVRVGSGYSEEFGVKVGVHQGSVLSPLLFIIVLEALSREFRTGCPWELLYADDLMISSESMEELLVKMKTWKAEMERKGLLVNMGKTKIMVSGPNLDLLKKSGKDPCGVCQTGVGRNAIFCGG